MIIKTFVLVKNKKNLTQINLWDILFMKEEAMPLYEYCCSGCGHKFELLRSMTQSNSDASCPKCDKKAEKVLSRFASFSKGSDGVSAPIAGRSSCSGCSSSSCSTCGG